MKLKDGLKFLSDNSASIYPGISSEYYCIADNYTLKEWKNTGTALVNKNTGKIFPLNNFEKETVLLCDGTINFCLPAVPLNVKTLAERLENKGYVIKYNHPHQTDIAVKSYNNRLASTVIWEITERCNYKCRHCFLSSPECKISDLPYENMINIIDQMADAGVSAVKLTGGEPLLRSDFIDIVSYLNKKDISIISIGTNGSLVTPELLDRLDEIGVRPSFYISFDGVGTHDWMRGIPGAERRVLEAHRLLSRRGYKSGSAIALYRGNAGFLRETVNALTESGCKHIIVNRAFGIGEWAKNGNELELSVTEYAEAVLNYLPFYFKDGSAVNFTAKPLFNYNAEKHTVNLEFVKKCGETGSGRLCETMNNTIAISAAGQVVPCYQMLGSPLSKKFKTIQQIGFKNCLDDEVYRKTVDLRIKDYWDSNPDCRKCRYAARCGAGCRVFALSANPENYFAKDNVSCELFHGGFDNKIKERFKDLDANVNFR